MSKLKNEDISIPASNPQFLILNPRVSIAYHKFEGKSPGIIFMNGFMSDMNGTKAIELERFCKLSGHSFIRFDYQGHGESGGNFADFSISDWANDSIEVLDKVSKGPQILVGSSMGGWIMLIVAIQRPKRIAGLVGIAAAPDFTAELVSEKLSNEQLKSIQKFGFIELPSEYGESIKFTKKLINDGDKNLVLNRQLPIYCPIRLLHGFGDTSVPWETAIRIQNQVASKDVEITFIKDGEHRLSREKDVELIKQAIQSLI